MSSVTLLCAGDPGLPEANLAKIAGFLGATVKIIALPSQTSDCKELREAVLSGSEILVTRARAFNELFPEISGDRRGQISEKNFPRHIFIYDFEQSPAHTRLLRALSSDALLGVEGVPAGGATIKVAGDCRKVCGQLSGVSFETAGSNGARVFVGGASAKGCSPLVSRSQKPLLARLKWQQSQVTLLAGDDIADLDSAVTTGSSALEHFCGLVPLMLFLRSACPESIWHNDQALACFIVDDPPLKKRYGFLDFRKLLDLMETKRFTTSIAFIPWNFARSEAALAEKFAAHPDRYSLCVHGCDHTRAEFGSSNPLVLREKAQLALDRMAQHRKSSGVGFDDVMVFPQGIFSTAAITALKSCGYLAAVNSSPYPVDAGHGLSLRELLQVAITRFSDFPLFTRRYPRQLAELAFDLFLGKPAFLVEHHGFFRDGYKALLETVAELYGMEPRLEWTNPGTACSRACLRRVAENSVVEIKFFTDRFSFRNDSARRQDFVLVRSLKSGSEPRAVWINGVEAPMQKVGSEIRVECSLDAGREATVTVEFKREAKLTASQPDRIYQAKVFVRRSLSEFRDNYLDRNPLLDSSARARRSRGRKAVDSLPTALL
jgi:hypothetical protein